MASVMLIAAIWDLRAEDVRLRRGQQNPGMRLELGNDVNIAVGHVAYQAADEAAAIRKLEQLAGELATELERRAAGKDGTDG